MDLELYLAERARYVNEALEGLLPQEETYPKSLTSAMRYSVFAGGKRLRPILTLASAEAVGGRVEDALNTACAIECIHTYSLIHDDLPAIDNDDLRRGVPTCHKVFGEAVAILAGDALLTLAFEIIGKTQNVRSDLLPKVIQEVARAGGAAGMIGGQVVDIESEGKEVPFPVLEYIHIHKTGALMLAAIRSGAIIGGGSPEEISMLTRYGEAIGLAFQISDDILDVTGSSLEIGKTAGSDEARGKATYVRLLGLDESRRRAEELIERALEALRGFDERAEPLRELAGFIISRKK